MLAKTLIFTTLATVGLGFFGNARQTAMDLLSVITVMGTSFAATKITDSLDPKMTKVIEFTGWCLCAGAVVSIIKSSFLAIDPFVTLVKQIVGGISYVTKFFAKLG